MKYDFLVFEADLIREEDLGCVRLAGILVFFLVYIKYIYFVHTRSFNIR